MEILDVGAWELLVVLLLAAIVLGPERVVRVARWLGRFVREVKAYFQTLSDELKSELDILDELKEVKDQLK